MSRTKHNNFLVGFLLSILVTLFVNFLMLMRSYDLIFNSLSNEDNLPPEAYFLFFSLGWFFLFSFVIFLLYNRLYYLADRIFKEKEIKSFLLATLLSIVAAYGFFLLYPTMHRVVMIDLFELKPPTEGKSLFLYGDKDMLPKKPPHEIGRLPQKKDFPMIREGMPPDYRFLFRPLFTEHLFVLLSVMLSVILLRQLRSKQEMMLAYEKLKSEKFKSSYNALMGQINPHFFFNSLNGLNALIRGGEKEQTLQYLDELSNVFRYILQSNHKELVSLSEELQFVKAYTYLLSVRYEGKLFFSIQTDPGYLFWHLPILSILPLVENAVKHNVISRQYPLRIDIYTTQDDQVVVSNKIQPKVEESKGSGIGLKNLWERYRILTGKDIYITSQKEYFKVSLPLIKNISPN
ncbi:histidine kinase [Massilibacteroides sp.]|uniref:sensor histidine kinase n=1 Tax=Massilibacteroides sp. TaxID=2034766 RepID=UPI00262255E7|nr:histidine kinase [Massilibacteroides sp.]MDD4514530.1 histidine kinase [Massilibacteroides sp.]